MSYLAKRQLSPVAAAVAAALGVSVAGTVIAQERQLEEIVVTTERRVATEATTAISMEVLSDDFLAENQIKDLIDLQNAVPALQFFQNGSYVQANVRGVGNPSRGGPSEQVGVPVFFDGATQGEEMGIASGFFDVSGIEVLRGPQATFVGQAAAGGAILINSQRPDFDGLNGYVEATIGDYGRRKLNTAVNIPVTDKFATRIAYMSENRDSYYTNLAGVLSPGAGSQWNPGAQEDDNFRVSLLWEPTEKLSVWTKLETSRLLQYGPTEQPNTNPYIGFFDDDGNSATPSIPVTTWAPHARGPDPALSVSDGNGGYLPGAVPGPGGVLYDDPDPFVLIHPGGRSRDYKVDRQSVEVNYQLDSGITFRSLSSVIVMNRLQTEGGNSAAYESLTGWQLGPGMKTWSQEFNLISPEGERLEWLVGLYENKRHTELHFNNPFGVGPIGGPALTCGWQYDSSWRPCPTSFVSDLPRFMWSSLDDVEHKAIFGQLNFHISDSLELQLEGRQNKDHNEQIRALYTGATTTFAGDAAGLNTVPCNGNVEGQIYYCPPPGEPDLSNPLGPYVWKGDLPTYKVGLNWEPRDGHFIYAFYARGYKAGQSTAFTASPIVEEVVDDVEIGWKGTIRPGLYAEFGIFSMDYKDMQLSTFNTAADLAQQATTNIGDSTIEGFEGSLRSVFGQFGFNLSFSWTDSTLGEITTVDTRALTALGLNVGATYPGDVSKGCTPAISQLGTCFDYAPYRLTFTGAENPFSPKLTYLVSVDYAFNLRNGGTLTPSLSYNYADSTYTNTLQRPDDNYYRTDDRKVLNFSLSYQKDLWDAQLFSNNVTDEIFIEGHSNSAAGVFYGDPRVVGFRVRRQF